MSAAGSTNLLQRLLEALISIPFLVLALIAIASAGPELSGNPILVVLVVALVYAPRIARMARAAAIDIATRDFVTVARLRGESAWSVMRRELLPNATSVLLVEFALRAGYAPVLIGSLGFLGFGLRPPTPEWGLMISENRALIIVTPDHRAGPGPGAGLAGRRPEPVHRGLGAHPRPHRARWATNDRRASTPRGAEPERRLPAGRRLARASWTMSASPCGPARCSGWSGNPAAASRPSRCSCSAIATVSMRVEQRRRSASRAQTLTLDVARRAGQAARRPHRLRAAESDHRAQPGHSHRAAD